jgi:EAL domain-containing protein (putative c-di-GMP-specific phosphodiesterase class I)
VHALGATVVAEGVETEDEAQIARDAGVDMLQGYLIGRPHGELSEGRLPLAANA